eukprot:TRINITY_DN23409_c1_g3_i3.p1 TRINITY_DN23409_c1_g3~~TRINITY_DN23409_c1_g3_i3.p1  ORF type:complete len:504 (-),score=89.94 TRINITY_DN23409_c1_g3_i3:37-1548(-)
MLHADDCVEDGGSVVPCADASCENNTGGTGELSASSVGDRGSSEFLREDGSSVGGPPGAREESAAASHGITAAPTRKPRLGGLFVPKKRKLRLGKNSGASGESSSGSCGEGSGDEEAEGDSASEIGICGSRGASSCQGVGVAATRRRSFTEGAAAASSTVACASCAAVEVAGKGFRGLVDVVTEMCSQRINDKDHGTAAAAARAASRAAWIKRGTEEETSTAAATRAASRAAWIRRGTEASCGKSATCSCGTGSSCTSSAGSRRGAPAVVSSGGTDGSATDSSSSAWRPPPRPRSMTAPSGGATGGSGKAGLKRSATGMYCAMGTAVDSTRCHWLLPPESLSIRVDPETSVFLQRQWLALAAAPKAGGSTSGRSTSSTAPRAREGAGCGKRSYPARLHAGWLVQTLRPRGWLAKLPENEARHLPFPQDLMSEPDRGPQRPNAVVVGRVIQRELDALVEETSCLDHDATGTERDVVVEARGQAALEAASSAIVHETDGSVADDT